MDSILCAEVCSYTLNPNNINSQRYVSKYCPNLWDVIYYFIIMYKYKDWILQCKEINGRTIYIFNKLLLDEYRLCDLPIDKEVIINERTGKPWVKTKKQS